MILLVLALSCSREVEKITVSSDPLSDLEAVTDLSIEIGDRVLVLKWSPPPSGSIQKYLIYRSDTTATNFNLYDSATVTEYTDEAVQNSIPYHYKISAISTTNYEGKLSHVISGIPGVFSIEINDDDVYTSLRQVTISPVYTSTTTHIMLSDTDDFSTSRWLDISGSVGWELPDADATHTVYARFKMSSGNESNDVVSDDIILDRFAEITAFSSNAESTVFEAGDVMHFALTTGESGGEASVEIPDAGDIQLYDNGNSGDAIADNGVYERDYTIPPDVEFENGLIVGSFTDPAGNDAATMTLSYRVTVRNAPNSVTLYVDALHHNEVELAWTESDAGDFRSYRIYRSESMPVTMESFYVGKITSASETSITDTSVVPSTDYNYIVVVTDESGLTSESNTLSLTTSDNDKPEDVVLVYEATDDETFSLKWTKNQDVDFESYRIFRATSATVTNSDANLFSIETSQSATTYTADYDTTSTVKYYYRIFIYDEFGLSSDGSNTVTRP